MSPVYLKWSLTLPYWLLDNIFYLKIVCRTILFWKSSLWNSFFASALVVRQYLLFQNCLSYNLVLKILGWYNEWVFAAGSPCQLGWLGARGLVQRLRASRSGLCRRWDAPWIAWVHRSPSGSPAAGTPAPSRRAAPTPRPAIGVAVTDLLRRTTGAAFLAHDPSFCHHALRDSPRHGHCRRPRSAPWRI